MLTVDYNLQSYEISKYGECEMAISIYYVVRVFECSRRSLFQFSSVSNVAHLKK